MKTLLFTPFLVYQAVASHCLLPVPQRCAGKEPAPPSCTPLDGQGHAGQSTYTCFKFKAMPDLLSCMDAFFLIHLQMYK